VPSGRIADQALIDTPLYADPDDVPELELLCKSCCNELKSD
jgi:hypothetical protein